MSKIPVKKKRILKKNIKIASDHKAQYKYTLLSEMAFPSKYPHKTSQKLLSFIFNL